MATNSNINIYRTRTTNKYYIVTLSFSTAFLVLTIFVGGTTNSPYPRRFGFTNRTKDVSNQFRTQITAAAWASVIVWTTIYIWQFLWTIYGWVFVVRSNRPLTISPLALIFYTFANITTIIWLYVFGNGFPQYSFGVILLLGTFLYLAIGFQALFLRRHTEILRNFKTHLYLTRILVLNGIAMYTTWVTIATVVSLAVVLQYFSDMSAEDAGTLGLSILAVEVVVYFILENTVLDSFTRPIVIVYPTILWALTGVISAHWGLKGNERNNIFSLILLIIGASLFAARVVLLIVFNFKRPLQ